MLPCPQVRDPPGQIEDLRTQLLAYKREDLRRVLAGSPLPPSFGSIVFTWVAVCPVLRMRCGSVPCVCVPVSDQSCLLG